MRGRLIQLFVKISVLTALVWVARRGLIRWVNGPDQIPSREPWPPLEAPPGSEPDEPAAGRDARTLVRAGPVADAGTEEVEAVGVAGVADAAGTPAVAAGLATMAAAPIEEPSAPPATSPVSANQAGRPDLAWLPPDESGACPPTHPVKAKRSTRLYREPGTAAYDRATPDRCYASAEAAEADGFSRAKR